MPDLAVDAAVLDLATACGFPLVARLDGGERVDVPRRAATGGRRV